MIAWRGASRRAGETCRPIPSMLCWPGLSAPKRGCWTASIYRSECRSWVFSARARTAEDLKEDYYLGAAAPAPAAGAGVAAGAEAAGGAAAAGAADGAAA